MRVSYSEWMVYATGVSIGGRNCPGDVWWTCTVLFRVGRKRVGAARAARAAPSGGDLLNSVVLQIFNAAEAHVKAIHFRSSNSIFESAVVSSRENYINNPLSTCFCRVLFPKIVPDQHGVRRTPTRTAEGTMAHHAEGNRLSKQAGPGR